MYVVKVSDLTCGSCAHSIKSVLQHADPSLELSVDLKEQTLTVKTNLEENKLKTLIEDAGFPVKETKRLD